MEEKNEGNSPTIYTDVLGLGKVFDEIGVFAVAGAVVLSFTWSDAIERRIAGDTIPNTATVSFNGKTISCDSTNQNAQGITVQVGSKTFFCPEPKQ